MKACDFITICTINVVPGAFRKDHGNEVEDLWTRSSKGCVLQKEIINGVQESRNEFMQYFWLLDNYQQEVKKNI